jgi:hypothetical protein
MEFTLREKHDIWQIPPEIHVLRVECGIGLHTAEKIIEQCRELEAVVFTGDAYPLSGEALEFLKDKVFIGLAGEMHHHGVDKETAKEIKEKWARGDHTVESLSKEYALPKPVVWHVIYEKNPHLDVRVRKSKKRAVKKV